MKNNIYYIFLATFLFYLVDIYISRFILSILLNFQQGLCCELECGTISNSCKSSYMNFFFTYYSCVIPNVFWKTLLMFLQSFHMLLGPNFMQVKIWEVDI